MSAHKVRDLAVLILLGSLFSCTSQPAVRGILDLRGHDWSQGTIPLAGQWAFGPGFRTVPDAWSGTEAGGKDGRGSGTYRLQVLLDENAPPLALRYGTAATAFSLSVGGLEMVRVGQPDVNTPNTVSAYRPGTVRLPQSTSLDLEFFVSNHEYRVGGLWRVPTLGPSTTIEAGQWIDEAGSLVLAAALAVIGFSTLLLFFYRRSEVTFLYLGLLALVVALRALVNGEYVLVRFLPALPFDVLIRLEYLTAFLPLPLAVLFFAEFFPRYLPKWSVRFMTWPSWGFAGLALILPLNLMTRTMPFFYPFAIPSLIVGTVILVRHILAERQNMILLIGVSILAVSGLIDMVTAAFFSRTGNLVTWGLGVFIALQAATLAQRLLAAYVATEALLEQKSLLIKEIHHRVKNSLQIVASLVSLQANRLEDPRQKEVFAALRRRITAIALVHEKLHGQGIDGRPNLGDYLKDLLKVQYAADGLAPGHIHWKIDTGSLRVGVDVCVDIGLILTELVGNAYKHSLIPRGMGELEVRVGVRKDQIGLEVQDDGEGFSPDFRPAASPGLGFRLILSLLQRNEGTLEIGPQGLVRVYLRSPRQEGPTQLG